MRIRLLKSYDAGFAKWPIGQLVIATNSLAKKLISKGAAIEYTGEYPPKKKKIKTDFFKPKQQ